MTSTPHIPHLFHNPLNNNKDSNKRHSNHSNHVLTQHPHIAQPNHRTSSPFSSTQRPTTQTPPPPYSPYNPHPPPVLGATAPENQPRNKGRLDRTKDALRRTFVLLKARPERAEISGLSSSSRPGSDI
ncbi:uncharacterized protein EI97DRAFT_430143 [Westerdykella ornata]|uniref:Uncharacterized protein n=1 Tax=Westerdykella ornata TaxID=318751 RepID=A0A6A6JW04_WESOR|nr:uncharacterized protein EI97DRAFT_430143 [Westerdykella ornata]KAF2280415.1 hypothetical protein EI97DRAFT_430143 [Westerdykella ornata]